MATLLAGVFTDSDKAGEAVAELKQMGHTEHISVVAKDETGELSSHQVKDSVDEGAITGALAGTALGGIVGAIAGAALAVVPAGTLLVFGPLAAAWGLTGGVVGALGGGLVGALVDAGIPEKQAEMLEERVFAGDVLVAVTGDIDEYDEIEETFAEYDAVEVVVVPEV